MNAAYEMCVACRGSGLTVGLNDVLPCPDCNGDGEVRARDERGRSAPAPAPAGDSGGERHGTGDDTFPQWLCQRFGGEPWATQSADDQAYWKHEAAATRRAVARNGFRAPAPAARSPR